MAISEPIVFQIANRTWCINEFGMDALFLLEGDEKALLIDTGTCVFDIPALVRRYTDKPLVVAVTHGHVDHAGGLSWFEEAYLHTKDFQMAKAITVEERQDYVRTIMAISGGIYDLAPEAVVNGPYNTRLLPLADGDVIHLGNRDVVAYDTPSHTPGSISLLDMKERIIYTGDACNMNTLLARSADSNSDSGTLSTWLSSAKKIESLHPFYDRNYNGHIGYAGWITQMDPVPECLTRDCIELCAGLLDGSRVGVPNNSYPFVGECLLAQNNSIQILYKPSQLR